MKKLITSAICTCLILSGIQTAFATETTTYQKTNVKSVSTEKPQSFDREKMNRPPKPNLEEELGLTEAQKQQARQNRINGRKEMKPIMEEIHSKKEAVLDIMDSDLSDEKKQTQIKTLQAEIKALHKKANELRDKNMSEFEKILTKEQKETFEKLKMKYNPNYGCKKCKMAPPPPQDY